VGRRRLGVYGESLPTKKTKVVKASDFLIGGIVGLFPRKYLTAFETFNTEEAREIFGEHSIPSYYGWDAVNSFWDNVKGVEAKLWIKSHVGYDGTDFDGVSASSQALNGAGTFVIKVESAYKDSVDFSVDGNKTAYTIENGARFSTVCAGAPLTGDLFLQLDSVAGIRKGDWIKCKSSLDTYVFKQVSEIEESLGRIAFSTEFGSADFLDGDSVEVMGFRLRIWRKSKQGLLREVDSELGKILCSMSSEVSDYYVSNVFRESKWVKVTDLLEVPSAYPINVSEETFLSGGADGTSPSTSIHWSPNLTALDNKPIRMLCNPETSDMSVQKAMETYCRGRWDLPKVIFNVPENLSVSQLITLGNKYQRSDDVLGVIVGNWIKITDPFSTSSFSLDRRIPSVGAVMGLWIRTVGTKGIHYIPCQSDSPLFNVNGVVGDQALDDQERTRLSDAGVNVIQEKAGFGTVVKNFFTPSTTEEFSFANGILMREYFKVSFVESLADTENEPNNFARIKESKMAILQFFYKNWKTGSTGNVPEGETFGQSIKDDGSSTAPEDHFQVQADLVNNPQSSINAGNRNLDSWFTFATPAGSIKIGVGLMQL